MSPTVPLECRRLERAGEAGVELLLLPPPLSR